MGICSLCGNDYDKSFEVTLGGKSYTFDSFGIRHPSPGPGLRPLRLPDHRARNEVDGRFFCCVHCAETDGVAGLKDRL